jgi:hypothetical protein
MKKSAVEIIEIMKYAPIKIKLTYNKSSISEYFKSIADVNYHWAYNKSRSLLEQDISITTKKVLAYLYLNYFCSIKEKNIIQEEITTKKMKEEQEKSEQFSYDNLFKRKED